ASAEYGAAFDRFQRQQETRYNRLSDLMKFGGGMAERAGANLIGAETYAGNIGTRGAEYAGDIGMRGAEWAGGARTRADEVMAQNAMGTQRSTSDLLTGGAAARAAGEVGAANAWQTGLQGVGNAAQQVGGYYQDKELLDRILKNPALSSQVKIPSWTYGGRAPG